MGPLVCNHTFIACLESRGLRTRTIGKSVRESAVAGETTGSYALGPKEREMSHLHPKR